MVGQGFGAAHEADLTDMRARVHEGEMGGLLNTPDIVFSGQIG
jgi:hypothetical protein